MSEDLFKDPELVKTLEAIHKGEPVVPERREDHAPEQVYNNANVDDNEDIVETERKYSDSKLILKPNGHIKELYIHQSLIKHMSYKGTLRDYCPLETYMTYITGKVKRAPGKSMLNGLYFEAGALNNGIDKDGNALMLERLKNGKKSTDNLRIDEQIFNFKNIISQELNLLITPQNIWRQFNAIVEDKTIKDKFDFSVFVELETDLLSPIRYKQFDSDLAILDLKLTIDRNGCFGEFCWGEPENMDHIQAFLYSYTLKLPFFYVVIDYKASGRGWKLVPVNTDVNNPDPRVSEEAKRRKREMFQVIRTVAVEIEHHHRHGWQTNPHPDNCKGCPVKDCKDKSSIKTI